jgi:adenosylhomocysteine nucleosidase
LIVSGDRFVATKAERDTLLAELPDALAVKMEGAAVAQVCHDFGLPLVVLRTVSDRADDTAHVDFAAFTREVASHYSARLLCSWLDGLGQRSACD